MLRVDPRNVLPHRIETARLVLRSPIRGDVPHLVKLADNRNIAKMLSRLPSPYTRADAIAFVEIFAQRTDERPFAITRDGEFLGIIGFSYFAGEMPELGYWLGEPHWGRGIVTEAGRALLEVAHATGQYRRVRARALAENAASIRVLAKLGFKPDSEAPAGPADGAFAGKMVRSFVLEQPR